MQAEIEIPPGRERRFPFLASKKQMEKTQNEYYLNEQMQVPFHKGNWARARRRISRTRFQEVEDQRKVEGP